MHESSRHRRDHERLLIICTVRKRKLVLADAVPRLDVAVVRPVTRAQAFYEIETPESVFNPALVLGRVSDAYRFHKIVESRASLPRSFQLQLSGYDRGSTRRPAASRAKRKRLSFCWCSSTAKFRGETGRPVVGRCPTSPRLGCWVCRRWSRRRRASRRDVAHAGRAAMFRTRGFRCVRRTLP